MLTPEQLKRRIGLVTSSTAAACLGLDPRMSQIDAWTKIKGTDTTEPEEMDANLKKAIERGNRLEELTLDYGADWLARELYDAGDYEAIEIGVDREKAEFRSIEPYLGDSCDALYFYKGEMIAIGEGKSASLGVGGEYGEEGTDEIPHHTLIQSHMHLIHWPEVERCVVPVLVGGYRFDFRCYSVYKDPDFEEIIKQDLKEWHERYIIGDEIPPARCTDENWLKRRYPKGLGGIKPYDPELKNLAFMKYSAAQKKKYWDKIECDIKAKLRDFLGDFEECGDTWGKVTWKQSSASFKTNWQNLALMLFDRLKMAEQERVDLIGKHTHEKEGPRVLRVTVKKPFRTEAENTEVSDG